MAIKSYKLGPGTLTFGDGGAQDASAQITNCRIDPTENVTSTDAIPTLSGDEIPAEDDATYTYALAGTLIQDIDAAGIVAYSWTNAGVEVPFSFVPNTDSAREVTGTVRMVPLTLGGDVKARNTSDFSMACIGTPAFGALA